MTVADENKLEHAIVLGVRDLLRIDQPQLPTSATGIKFPGRTS
jgi:hypothetical protein